MIGDGIAVLLQRAFRARGAEPGPDDLRAYVAAYDKQSGQRSRLYEGTAEALDRTNADGWTLAVCTNKPERPARELLSALGLGDRFAAICGGDSFAVRKPNPDHLRLTVAAAGGEVAQAVMVGDLVHDLHAARGAGIPSVWAGWGYGAPDTGSQAEAIAHRWGDVPALAGQLLGGRA
jgi:phosphoglycolate phosphatase